MNSVHLLVTLYVVLGLAYTFTKAPRELGTAIGALFVILFFPIFFGKHLGSKIEARMGNCPLAGRNL